MTDPAEFAQAINLANSEVAELVGVYNALLQYAADKLKFNTDLQLLPLERESVHRLALLDTVPRRELELPVILADNSCGLSCELLRCVCENG